MSVQNIEPVAVSVATFSAMTGLGRTTAYTLMRSQRLKKVKVRGRTLITVASIKNLLATDTCEVSAA